MILTVSDGVAAGSREDRSGAVVAERLIGLGYAVTRNLVADEPELIAAIVSEAADSGTRLIISTGGTGLGPRDRTPEGVMTVVDYVVPGFGEVMRAEGRTHTPLASLSRSFAAVRGQTLIICVPGSPRGAMESLDAVEPILEHALATLGGRTGHDPSTSPDAD
jgi:molybdenum cofactor synthesis domain-containing protein